MEEKRLTDKEIVKALKCCMRIDGCDKCPLAEIPTIAQCRNNKNKCAIELINHLQRENKRLKQPNKNILFVNEQVMSENAKQKAEIERLTEELEIEKHNHKATQWFYNNSCREGLRLLDRNKELVRGIEELQDLKFTKEHCDLWQENKWLKECLQQAVKDTAKEIYGLAVVYYDGNSIACMFLNELEERYGVEVE